MPVWHEGDPIEVLEAYVEHAQIVGIGRTEARRSDRKTLDLYDEVFNQHPDGVFHALGNCNPKTLERYPFTSFDGVTWQLDSSFSEKHGWPWSRVAKETRMKAYIEATETIRYKPATPGAQQ
jgi:hypothetical protein